jgi:hypothetical protein
MNPTNFVVGKDRAWPIDFRTGVARAWAEHRAGLIGVQV